MSKSLLKSTSVVVSMTMISRVFGFIRDMVTAHFFGAGASFDAFSVAFKIPNFMRRLFAEGSFSQAFVPVLAEYQKIKNHDEVKQFVNAMTGTLALTLFFFTILGIIFAPSIVFVFAPGFANEGDRFDLAVTMLRVTFPYLMFISLTALSSSILNTYKRFWVGAITPVFLNICMISTAIFLSPKMQAPVVALAYGVFIAGIIQFLFQLPFLKHINLMPWPIVNFNNPGVRRVLKLMLPALFGVSVGQINLLVDTLFASLLTLGSVSWLYYSDRLMEFPLGVFGVAISTVILPNLSHHYAMQSAKSFSLTVDWALRAVLLIGVPAAIAMALMSGPMLSTLFQYGLFDGHDVKMSGRSLIAFALGITPFMLVKVLASGFYAQQDMVTPVRIGVVAMIANIVFNALLIWPLAHAGIALATSLAAFINSGLLLFFLHKRKYYQARAGWKLFSLRLLVSNLVLFIWLWIGSGDINVWITQSAWWRVSHLLFWGMSAIIIYLVMLMITGVRWHDLLMPKQD